MSAQSQAIREDANRMAWGENVLRGISLEALVEQLAAKHTTAERGAIEYFARVALQGDPETLPYKPWWTGATRQAPWTGVAGRQRTDLDRQVLDLARNLVIREPGLARDNSALRRGVESEARAEGLDADDFAVRQAVTDAVLETWVRVAEPYYERAEDAGQSDRCATAERALVGVILCQSALADVVLPEVPADDIRDPACRAVWETLRECRAEGLTVDAVTVLSRLRQTGRIAQAGGGVFLAECVDHVAAPSFWPSHAKIVRDAGVHRRALAAAQQIQTIATATDSTAAEVVTAAEREVGQLGQTLSAEPSTSAADAVRQALAVLDDSAPALSTGLKKLDKALGGGLRPGKLYVLAGRPGMGKSALGAQLAIHAAWSGGPTIFASLEMTAGELMERAVLAESRVNGERFRSKTLNPLEMDAVIQAADNLSKLRLRFIDDGTLTVAGLKRRVHRLAAEWDGLALLVVDYVQLLMAGDDLPRGRSREQEVAHASRALKALAKDLSVPIVALAQLNRSVESRTERRPMLSDLRESGSLEQDADVVLMLYREEYYDHDTKLPGVGEVIVAKNRAGRRGKTALAWVRDRTTFENLEESEYARWEQLTKGDS